MPPRAGLFTSTDCQGRIKPIVLRVQRLEQPRLSSVSPASHLGQPLSTSQFCSIQKQLQTLARRISKEQGASGSNRTRTSLWMLARGTPQDLFSPGWLHIERASGAHGGPDNPEGLMRDHRSRSEKDLGAWRCAASEGGAESFVQRGSIPSMLESFAAACVDFLWRMTGSDKSDSRYRIIPRFKDEQLLSPLEKGCSSALKLAPISSYDCTHERMTSEHECIYRPIDRSH